MSPPLLASLLSRCLAIWLFLGAVDTSMATVQMALMGPPERGWLAWSAAVAAATFGIAAWAWVEAPRAARFLLRGLPDVDESTNLGRDGVERMVFVGIGLLVLAKALPSVAHWGVRLYLLRGEPFAAGGRLNRPLEIANLVGDLARIAVGLLLVLRADGIRRWIASVRGLNREESA